MKTRHLYREEANGDGAASGGAGSVETITDWRTALPEQVQQWDEVKNATDADAFYSNMGDMRSMIGRSLQIPSTDAGAEAQQAYLQKVLEKTPDVIKRPDAENMGEFYDSMGRPEGADKYTSPESTEALPINGDAVDQFREVAYAAGLTQAQFDAVTAGMSQNAMNQNNTASEARNGEMTGLKGEWGMAFDQNIAIANKIKNEHFPHIGVDVSQLDAATIKSLHSLGKAMIGEGANVTADDGADAVMTPAEADHLANEIQSDKKGPYWNQSHPNHKSMVAKVIALRNMANPK